MGGEGGRHARRISDVVDGIEGVGVGVGVEER